MAFESPLKTSESLKTFDRGEELLDFYIEEVKHDLEKEVEKIIAQKPELGEGKAANVFDLELDHVHCPVCVKIWKPELEDLKKHNLIGYKKIQAQTPEEEFEMQDRLYLSGFANIPRPIAYGKFCPYHVLAMEKIIGFSLRELIDNETKIGNLSWRELELLLIDLNRNHRIAHRDLHSGNIMVETDEPLKKQGIINVSNLYIIDFGLSKETAGMPTPEDFHLTIGNNSVVYRDDKTCIDGLRPTRQNVNRSPFTK